VDWKYFIPHIWEGERQVWEDVYLLPVGGRYDGQALWLTIDALGKAEDSAVGAIDVDDRAEALRKLGDRSYHIDGTDMLVRQEDFTKAEMLEWVRVWLRDNGLPVSELIEAPLEEFQGRAQHADLIAEFRKMGLA
jgi:hypothetical protein